MKKLNKVDRECLIATGGVIILAISIIAFALCGLAI